jgi:hypothetical protein
VPRRDLPYPAWLALSFLPGAAVPLAGSYPAPESFEACLLAVPKWTLGCPPVNRYLDRFGARLPPTALIVTYGGFDEARYIGALERRLRRAGVRHLGTLGMKRRHVEADAVEAELATFLGARFPAQSPDEPRRSASSDSRIVGSGGPEPAVGS